MSRRKGGKGKNDRADQVQGTEEEINEEVEVDREDLLLGTKPLKRETEDLDLDLASPERDQTVGPGVDQDRGESGDLGAGAGERRE